MEDVARRAGVSIATVSRTLRDQANVAEETRRRVLRAAEELSYVVSPIASRLATGRTGAVGVVIPYASRWYFGQVIAGAESVLRDCGLDLLLYNVGDQAARKRFFERQPLRRRVDAVLAVAMPFTDSELSTLHGLGVPMTVVGFDSPGIPSVRINEAATIDRAMQHLFDLGHRRIAMISTYADQNVWLPVAHQRRTAYLAALAEAGVEPDPQLVISVPFSVGNGERATAALLALEDPPTAIFAESDELAFGALTALRRAGIGVPESVSVLGVDDHDVSQLLDLTTMRQLVFQQGSLAAKILAKALGIDCVAPEPDTESGTVLVPTTLIIRGSTGPAPHG
ncbi:MAG: LacI family DNA-binding transcriptional regulator [Dactylosporangium sp.]|nr:LacI family transcriptional regulator [Dactylosporangium sp.]NNJ60062.1 LacI family DNA-binding transcriptional regulator [Dactylosporangium sp.]